MHARAFRLMILAALLLLVCATPPLAGQVSDLDRGRALAILRNVERLIDKHLYDEKLLEGLALRFDEAEVQLAKADSLGQLYGAIAGAVLSLNDSHTRFLPPSRTLQAEYGWRMRAFGDAIRITSVQPGSDAEAKGLRPGARILAVDGRALTRSNLPLFDYRYYLLQPESALRLVVEDLDGAQRELEIQAEIERRKRLLDLGGGHDFDYWEVLREAQNHRWVHRTAIWRSPDGERRLFYWRLPSFSAERSDIRRYMGKARKHDAMILDLRGNGGGLVRILVDLLGYLFDRDVMVGRWTGRDGTEVLKAKTRGKQAFTGPLVVLVDSDSASASEVLARILQLEGRGVVMGDRTRGAVNSSRFYRAQLGGQRTIVYGVQITRTELRMADGGLLEGVGVTPGYLWIPTGEDLAARRDVVLAQALDLLGFAAGSEEPPPATIYHSWD